MARFTALSKEQRGLALHLIERDRLVSSHQRLRIAPGGSQHVEVIQSAVAPVACHELLSQGALAGLMRARDHHRRHHRQTIGEGAADHSGQWIHVVDEFHSPCEWYVALAIEALHAERPVPPEPQLHAGEAALKESPARRQRTGAAEVSWGLAPARRAPAEHQEAGAVGQVDQQGAQACCAPARSATESEGSCEATQPVLLHLGIPAERRLARE